MTYNFSYTLIFFYLRISGKVKLIVFHFFAVCLWTCLAHCSFDVGKVLDCSPADLSTGAVLTAFSPI